MSKWIAAALSLLCVPAIAAQRNDRVDLRPDFSEANAVLAILDKRAKHERIDESDWQKLFATIPYQRLKQRESSMRRLFSDEDFKKFVTTLDARRTELRETLTAWSKADLLAAAERPLRYLPADATIHASVYPVIKPHSNSFVFEASANPAIFLYLDPHISRAQFENTVAHELHHIGLSSLDEKYEQRIQGLPENARKAARWMGAFGEGMAVLAGAGSPDVAPLAAYSQRDQIVWDVDFERADSDLEALNQFFLDVIHGDIRGDAVPHVGSTFFGFRGPWYTVGYLMATTIEKQFGRTALVDTFGDPRQFVAKYNEAASMHNAKGEGRLPLFSVEILEAAGAKTPTVKQQ